ncbi:MAG: molybdopterin molybdenumtransferase MoeA [Microbacterium sp.]|nr:molybdopterin molybdenumtransferase MoeA [Microbacterium sp.]
MSGMRTVEEQLAVVLAAVRTRSTVTRTLDETIGFTLAEPARAHNPVPVFDNSAMDGFAVRFADVATASEEHPAVLRVVADVPAGSAEDPPLARNTAARIMTGAPVPAAADTVVPFEDTAGGLADSLGEIRVVRAPRGEGAHVRRTGEDAVVGVVVLEPGTLLGARQLAALASVGIAQVLVAPRPRVAIVSTGAELVPPGEPLLRGQIPESNGLLLAGLVAEAGGEVVFREVVGDDAAGPAEAVARATALGLDAVIFSGGVSAGAYEPVRQGLSDAMEFVKVAMQPGKPQGFGATAEGMLLFGLPGNPVSVAVSFEVLVRPALLRMQGRHDIHRPRRRLVAGTGWRTPPGRRQYLPAVIDADGRVHPATRGGSGSHLAVGLGAATAYAIVAAETEQVEVGDLIDVLELS